MTARTVWTRTNGQAAVRNRSYWCELRVPGICLGQGASFSHRKPAIHGGGYEPSNGNRACGSGTTGCHGYLEDRPLIGILFGWRVPRGNPADVPCFIWLPSEDVQWQGWVFLTDTDPGDYITDGALEAALALGLPEHPTIPTRGPITPVPTIYN